SADCARIYRDGLSDMGKLEDVDRWRFGALMQMLVSSFYYTKEFSDVFGDDQLESIRMVVGRPGFRQWWPEGRRVMPVRVAAYIDKHVEAVSRLEPGPAPTPGL